MQSHSADAPSRSRQAASGIPYLIALGAFALGMASYITAGLIPLIETDFGVPVALAAQLVTAFTLAYGLGSPVVVAMLPATAQRTGLLAALGLFVVANGASALSTDFYWLMVFRALAGIGAGVYLATGIAASAMLSAPEKRGKSIAIIMGGMASGTVLGVPFGLLLADRWGWSSSLWLVTALGAAAWIGLGWRLPSLPGGPAVALGRKLALLADRQVLVILSVSLLAAVASLGMYTFIAPLLVSGPDVSVTPYLWAWGIGGVVGSFLVGPVASRIRAPLLTLGIMLLLAAALLALPMVTAYTWMVMLAIVVWGATGWALQVPQNDELIRVRERQGDGNLAVALNESALYLGSALGAAAGGLLLMRDWPVSTLAIGASAIAIIGTLLQWVNLLRRQ